MGKLIEEKALSKGVEITAIANSKSPISNPILKNSIAQADVCIDFSLPSCAIENIKLLTAMKKNIVIGTTGWTDKIEEVRPLIEKAKIGFIYSPNFSLGVALFLNIVEEAASLILPFEEYDVSGFEIHHRKKIDTPSGTAKALIDRIDSNRAPACPKTIFSSMRVGDVPGTHTVLFDSAADTITLTHTARNREGFASGALTAAEWIQGKQGIFTIKDLLSDRRKQRV